MADLYSRTIRSLDTDIMLITQRIDQAQLSGETVNPDWLRRESRYQRLLVDAEREFARFADDGLRVIESGQIRAVRGGAAQAWELMDASGIDVSFGGRVNTIAVENALSATTSAPLRRSLLQYGTDGSQKITDTLLDGISRGRGPRSIIRDIRRGLNSPYNKARLESLVRTEMMRASNFALEEQYKQMDHLISGYRWSAAKSIRTCLACLSMDGRIFKTYQHTQHVNCRCICTPVPRGSTYQYQTGQQWLREQPGSVQQKMFPTADAFLAFSNKKVTLRDFEGRSRSPVWGTSVRQRSWRDVAERKGLPYETDAGKALASETREAAARQSSTPMTKKEFEEQWQRDIEKYGLPVRKTKQDFSEVPLVGRYK